MRATVVLAGALMAGLSWTAAGCSAEDADTGPPCGLIVDATSFAVNTDVSKKIKESVPQFLAGCDSVAFSVISGSVAESDCRHNPVELIAGPQDNPNNNETRARQINQARRSFAMNTMYDLIHCARGETSTKTGSDIIGALLDAGQKAATLSGPASLLVISDMAQNTSELNLYKADVATTATREAIIGGLRQTRRLPQLKGATVEIIGFGIHVTPDLVRQQQLKDFWQLLFDESGTRSVSYL
jgi:hypothetical protein